MTEFSLLGDPTLEWGWSSWALKMKLMHYISAEALQHDQDLRPRTDQDLSYSNLIFGCVYLW